MCRRQSLSEAFNLQQGGLVVREHHFSSSIELHSAQ